MELRDPLVGRVIGGAWRVERRLGARGVGAVYEICHQHRGGYYVLEVLLGGHAPSNDAFARFQRTVYDARALRHPNIVTVHDVGRLEDGAAYVVMDYLDGEDLATRLERDGALSWPDARRVLDGAAEALSSAHAVGIHHGHLDPASIFLMRGPGRPQKAMVMHFGVAELAALDDDSNAMRDTGGYPRQSAYESPETIQGEQPDARSDLYSLAAILFEMVTGKAPYTGPNAPAILARVLTEEVPDVTAYARQPTPTGLDELLKRALAKEPGARLGDVDLFRKKLQSLEAMHSWSWPAGAELTAPIRRARAAPDPAPEDAEVDDPPPPPALAKPPSGRTVVLASLGVAAIILVVAAMIASL